MAFKKKFVHLLLLTWCLTGFKTAVAQTRSIEETKKILCDNKWFLRRLEEDGKMFTVPKELQGLKMVFNASGTTYSYMPSDNEKSAEIWKWELTKTTLTIIKNSGKTVDNYILRDFIGYELYLTDAEEDDMPTFVFEQAEKNTSSVLTESKSKVNIQTTSNVFDDFDYTELLNYENNKPQWRFFYTKGAKMGIQRRQQTRNFPEKEIQKDWLDGRYVTDLCFGGPDNDEYWVLINSKNNFTDQMWRTTDNTTELKKTIEDVRNKNPDFYISHISYGENKWVLIFSKGTTYTGQTTIISTNFPEEDIKTYGGKGFSITDMAYGSGKWVVGMSKNPSNLGQHYLTPDTWDKNRRISC